MRKLGRFLLIAGVAVISMCSTVFAGTWKDNQDGWYWEEDDGAYPAGEWKWIDGNQDGVAECYYFNEQGYLLTSQAAPDGHQVDADGRWVVNGEVQKQGETQAPTDARQVYQAAVNKTNELNNFAASANIAMNMSASGMTLEMTADMNMKVKDQNSSNMKYLADMRIHLLGETTDATMFYTDGYCYMDMDGSKVKMAMPLDDIIETSKSGSSSMLQDPQYLKDVQMSDDGNGNKVLAFTCEPESFNELLKQVSRQTTDLSNMGNMQIREYYGTVTVNSEGYIVSSDIVMKFEANISDTPVAYDIKMNIKYNNPGQFVDFALPSTEGYTSS